MNRRRLAWSTVIGVVAGVFLWYMTDHMKWIAVTVLLAAAIGLALPDDPGTPSDSGSRD